LAAKSGAHESICTERIRQTDQRGDAFVMQDHGYLLAMIEQATKFKSVVHLKTAKALGIDMPPSILLCADEVIEGTTPHTYR
jgi:hypothetical protein